MVLANAGAAVVYEQKNLTSDTVIDKVDELISNPAKLADMAENAKKLAISDTNDRIYATLKRNCTKLN